MSRRLKVCETWELSNGDHRKVVLEGHAYAVLRVDDVWHVVDDACPHRGASLGEEGHVDRDGYLVCNWHRWVFDPATGDVDGGLPGCLPVFPVVVEGEEVFIEVADPAAG